MSNFGSGTASGPLSFTSGAVSIVGKYFNGTGGITISGCGNVSIQNCDFADGNNITIDGSAGTILLSHCRFRNPPVNGIKITNSTFTGTGIVHNSFRGRQAATKDYIYVGNSGGTGSTAVMKIEYNHVDSSDPVTGAFSYPANGGSGIFYGAVTTPGVGYCNFIYNTLLNPGPYGIHVDSGVKVSLYYDVLFGQSLPNSVAPVFLSKGAGTQGGDVEVTLMNSHWENPSGAEVAVSDDGTLAVTYSQIVTIAVDLNAIVTS
jgi:hypothetical protein